MRTPLSTLLLAVLLAACAGGASGGLSVNPLPDRTWVVQGQAASLNLTVTRGGVGGPLAVLGSPLVGASRVIIARYWN